MMNRILLASMLAATVVGQGADVGAVLAQGPSSRVAQARALTPRAAMAPAANIGPGIGNPIVTNLLPNGFTVVFTTTTAITADVVYSQQLPITTTTALDDRDVANSYTNPTIASVVHSVTLSGLSVMTTTTNTAYFAVQTAAGAFPSLASPLSQNLPIVQAYANGAPSPPDLDFAPHFQGSFVAADSTPITPTDGYAVVIGKWNNNDGTSSAPVSCLNSLGDTTDYACGESLVKSDGSLPGGQFFTLLNGNSTFAVSSVLADFGGQLATNWPRPAVRSIP